MTLKKKKNSIYADITLNGVLLGIHIHLGRGYEPVMSSHPPMLAVFEALSYLTAYDSFLQCEYLSSFLNNKHTLAVFTLSAPLFLSLYGGCLKFHDSGLRKLYWWILYAGTQWTVLV